nr:helix-turn-helix domain-containing protein [uncultured Flavobacterium sp.]
MENLFELILEKLELIEITIEKLNTPAKNDSVTLLSRKEACELLKINFTSLWKHTKSGKLKSYGIGNRVYYKKEEIMKSITRIN